MSQKIVHRKKLTKLYQNDFNKKKKKSILHCFTLNKRIHFTFLKMLINNNYGMLIF